MATQVERRTKTRAKLRSTARRLFDKHGFDAVSVDQIVTAANVSKGTFYQYYETKIEILIDVVRDQGAEGNRQALEAVAGGVPAIPVLEQYIERLCTWFEANEKIAEAVVFASFNISTEEVGAEPNNYTRAFLMSLLALAQQQGAIRDDVPTCELAKVLGGSLVASVLWWCKDPQPGGLVESMACTLKIFLEGAKI